MHSEDARQWVHVGSGLFALLLRALTPWQASGLAALALVFNALALPRLGGRRLYRPADDARGFPLGILLYPLAVVLLTLIFPTRPDITAGAWGIMAFGDGAATLVGRAWRPKTTQTAVPWNPDKSVAGTLGFVAFGGLGGVALALWTRPAVAPLPPVSFTIAGTLAAAVVAAFVETLPVRLDDNLSVPAAAAATMWIASLMDRASFVAASPALVESLPRALGVNALASWLGHRAGTVSRSGAVAGAVVGIVIYCGGGGRAWAFLFATFLAATVASRLGLKRKALLGIAEARSGRRGAGNAIANCGVAACAAVAAVTTPHAAAALLAMAAALTAGGSDTVASEIGKAWGRSTFLVTTVRRVRPGTPGAMSAEGTAAGLVAAFGLAALANALGLMPASAIIAVVVGTTAGALVESVLAATLEGPGILNNDMLNFINTGVAAIVALALA
jgi:uncharacterized protein (TIGR00297 family)